jgi:hypothetical protein
VELERLYFAKNFSFWVIFEGEYPALGVFMFFMIGSFIFLRIVVLIANFNLFKFSK